MNYILLFFISSVLFHPIHLSKCEVEINRQSSQLEITLHVYIDDLQEIIQKSGSPELFLATDQELINADSLIVAYLTNHLMINNGAHPIALNWLGKEQSDDLLAFWCYFETKAIVEGDGLQIINSVLHDLYDDQQNILNVVKSDGKEVYFLCRKGDNQANIK